jgi:Secretion system C-terminal sorting domain
MQSKVYIKIRALLLVLVFSSAGMQVNAQAQPLVVDSFINAIFGATSFKGNYYLLNNKLSKADQANFQNIYDADSTALELLLLNKRSMSKTAIKLKSKKDTVLVSVPPRAFTDYEQKNLFYCALLADSVTNLAYGTVDFYKNICILKFDTLNYKYLEYRLINYDTGITLAYGNKLIHHDSILYTEVVNKAGKAWLAKYNLNTGLMIDTVSLFQIQLGYLYIQADFLNDSTISLFVNPIQQINVNTMQNHVKNVITFQNANAVVLPKRLELIPHDSSYVTGGGDNSKYKVIRIDNGNVGKIVYEIPFAQTAGFSNFYAANEAFCYTSTGGYFVGIRSYLEQDTFALAYGTRQQGHIWIKTYTVPDEQLIMFVTTEADENSNCLVILTVRDAVNVSGYNAYYLMVDSNGLPLYPLSIELPQSKYKSIALYPNPTHSVFNLDLSPNEKVSEIRLLDYHGKQVRTYASATNCSVADLPRGVYFVEVMIDNQKFMSRLLLE